MTADEAGALVASGESLRVEFKQQLNPTNGKGICKEVVAMANSGGGTILIGVADAGIVLGVNDPTAVRDRIEQWCHHHIAPTLVVDVSIVDIGTSRIVAIGVPPGSAPPYAYSGRYYQRIGTAAMEMTADQLVDLLRGRTIEQALAALQSAVSVAQSTAVVAQHAVAPAIHGQGDLATRSFTDVRDLLRQEILGDPVILALQSGVAVAQSTANLAMVSTAPFVQGQTELATMTYDALVERLMRDPRIAAAISAAQAHAAAAMSQATMATSMAQKALHQVAALKAKLAAIGQN